VDEDILFIKRFNGAHLGVERGWFCEAVIQLKSPTGKAYYIQCTTWRDKKQVYFLHNFDVGASVGLSVMRHVKGKNRVFALEVQERGRNMQNISMRWIEMIEIAPTTLQASGQIDITFTYFVGSWIK